MSAEELVDGALAGFDAGEDVTTASLPDRADWDALNAARTFRASAPPHAIAAPRPEGR